MENRTMRLVEARTFNYRYFIPNLSIDADS